MTDFASAIVPLPQISVLQVTGADATDFLQAQLSRGVDDLTPERSALAGWHDARGKVRAVFRVLPISEGYLLLGPADLADQLTAALRMFVLRAQVHVEQPPLACGGMLAGDAAVAPAHWLPGTPNAAACSGAVTAICVTDNCWLFIGAADQWSPQRSDDRACAIAATMIRAGLPQVDKLTTTRYVPHMLNLDKLDAIDFQKGCFPGQEIIARTQHLGSVKRRARAFVIEPSGTASAKSNAEIPRVDTPVVDAKEERIGEVIGAARDRDGTVAVLAVVTLTAVSAPLYLDSAGGPQLTPLTLPFE